MKDSLAESVAFSRVFGSCAGSEVYPAGEFLTAEEQRVPLPRERKFLLSTVK